MYELEDIVVDGAAFFDGCDNGREVVVRHDHVRDLLGDVCPGDAHGDADVSFLDGWSIVDAVARHGHDRSLNMRSVRHRPIPSAPKARALWAFEGVSALARTPRRRMPSA